MKPHSYVTWGCLCAVVALSTAAVVPTPDTYIVSRSDEPTTAAVPSKTSTEASDPTTEGPTPPLKMTEMLVNTDITMRYAHTLVFTRVRNPAKKAQEATFRVLLPETAFISGFTMTLDGKEYKAYVKEKEEAKQIYNDAVSHGIGAAHVAAKARDSNHFVVSVNIEPNSKADFNLTYEELLVRRNNVYHSVTNIHPGTVLPKLQVIVRIKESQKLTVLRVPDVRTGNEIDASEDAPQNSKAVITKSTDVHEAVITFTPDIDEQKRLMEIYAAKTKESMANSHHGWYDEENTQETDGIIGQFVVQYDVDRPKDGEILVNDGYFVHFYAPTSLPPLNKFIIFVLDTSGSMMGRKIEQLREAMQSILSELNKGDYFSLVEFASSVKVHDIENGAINNDTKTDEYFYYEETKPATLLPPALATPENIAKAKAIVSKLNASGGTNIEGALDIAIQLIHKGIGWTPVVNESTSTTTTKTSDEASTTEATKVAKREAADVDSDKQQEKKQKEPPKKEEKKPEIDTQKPEPIIIFLTDGDPTVGETDPKRIITHLSEKNYGEDKASIFSLAFGEDADRSLLRKLSLRNEGFMRHIYEAADAALQLRDFYRQVSSPLLSHVKFVYSPEQVKEDSVTKRKFRTIYAGGETVVAGRITDDVEELSPKLLGFCGVRDGVGKKLFELTPKVAVKRTKEQWLPLERLWAYLTIKQLLDERDALEIADHPKEKEVPEKKALALALKYEFVTSLTSLVVVKPNATKAVDAESVDAKPGGFGYAASYGARPLSLRPAFAGPAGPAAPASGGVQFASYMPMSYSNRVFGGGFAALSSSRYHGNAGLFDSSISGIITTPAPPPVILATTTTPVQNDPILPSAENDTSVLAPYHLESCRWIEPLLLLPSDELQVTVNGAPVLLKLTKDSMAPKSSSGDAECPSATDGNTGLCVYLTRCAATKDLTADQYASIHCKVDNSFAGVCCPKAMVDTTTS